MMNWIHMFTAFFSNEAISRKTANFMTALCSHYADCYTTTCLWGALNGKEPINYLSTLKYMLRAFHTAQGQVDMALLSIPVAT